MKPNCRDYRDENGECDREALGEALDDWGEAKFEQQRDREMEELISEEHKQRQNEAIVLIKELLGKIESGDIVVDGVNIRTPDDGGFILKDETLLNKITELKLRERRIK